MSITKLFLDNIGLTELLNQIGQFLKGKLDKTDHLVINEVPGETIDPVDDLSFSASRPSLFLKNTISIDCNDNASSSDGELMSIYCNSTDSKLASDDYCPVLFRYGKASSNKKGWFVYIPENYTPRTQPYMYVTKQSNVYFVKSLIPIISRIDNVVSLFPKLRLDNDTGGLYVPHLSKNKYLTARRNGHRHEQKFRWGIAFMKKSDYATLQKPWINFDTSKLATNIMPFRVSYRYFSGHISVSVVL